MKNLFIFWDEPLNLTSGGIHRCIASLMKYLPSRGFNVHYIYSIDHYKTFHFPISNDNEKIFTLQELKDFLTAQKCDIILGQEAVFSTSLTKAVKALNLSGVKFINQYHSTLLYFEKKLSWDYLKLEWNTNRCFSARAGVILRGVLYPLWKHHVRRVQNKIYRFNYENSDVSLLLSEYEKPIMNKIAGDSSFNKCVAIPNALSWEEIGSPDILKSKQKEVLIVSRLYNSEKRIDLALKVWKMLELKGATEDWTLRIVGEGIHKAYLMEMAESMQLRHVVWEGRQDPRTYYERASIFLMTSIVEGWGLTLTESMQSGVVPVAFDSYPAVRSIISDGFDGYLIPTKKLKMMADKLCELMHDKAKRERMALNGLQSSGRFTINTVMNKWQDMLNRS